MFAQRPVLNVYYSAPLSRSYRARRRAQRRQAALLRGLQCAAYATLGVAGAALALVWAWSWGSML